MLLESFLPDSLRLSEEQIRAEEKKLQPSNEPPTPVKKTVDKSDANPGAESPDVEEPHLCLTPEEESEFVDELLGSVFSGNFLLLEAVSDFLLKGFQKFGSRTWPVEISNAFLRCS